MAEVDGALGGEQSLLVGDLLLRVTSRCGVEGSEDPAFGIARVLDHDDVLREGGTSKADWFVLFKPGYEMAIRPDAPLPSPSHYRGMHGFDPSLAQMRSTFIVAGKGVPAGKDFGDIEMRDIAPTVARLLGVSLPQAQGKSLLR